MGKIISQTRGIMKQDIVLIENTKFIEILLHYRGVTN